MSLLDVITSLQTDNDGPGTYVVTRRAAGAVVNGRYARGAVTSTFSITAVVQSATGMQRIVPGKDMHAHADGQTVDDTYELHTETPLLTRSASNEPDFVTIEGADWVVMRVERWEMTGDVFYRAIVARDTSGAA